MTEVKFGAFIITYQRKNILEKTIQNLLSQTLSPEVILIVDNSDDYETKSMLENLDCPIIQYHRVGYNSGPAGGSKIGLEILATKDVDWIYWGDDDDPPRDSTTFSHLFKGIEELLKKDVPLGIFAGKAAHFNPFTGKVKSLSNSELKASKFVEGDFVAGNQTMLVNAEVIRKGVLPEEKLFFGFEDLDFSLKVKKAGYKIYTDSEFWLKVRKRDGFNAGDYRWKGNAFGKKEVLHREFYTVRSLLYIFYSNRLYLAFLIQLMKSILKMFAGFFYGISYGTKMFKIQGTALISFFSGNYKMRANRL